MTWVSTHKDSCWHGTPNAGTTGLWLACPGLDVAKDQLPSPWSLGAPAGKDICQRESWQLYFLFHLGLSLIHPSCSFPFSSIFFLLSSHSTPPFYSSVSLSVPDFILSILSFPLSLPSISILHPRSGLLRPLPHYQFPQSLTRRPTPACLRLLSPSLFACWSGWYSSSPHDCTSQLG